MHSSARRNGIRRCGLLVGGTGLVLAGVGMAAGSAAAASTFTISGSLNTALWPGVGGPLDLTITNPNDAGLHLSTLTVAIDAVTPAACALSNFAVNQAVLPPSGSAVVPAHGALTLSALGLTVNQLPQVRMLDTGVPQNECQGAALHLVYTGTALGGSGSFPGGGDNGNDHDGHGHDHDHDGHHHDGDGDDDDDSDGSGSGSASAGGLPGTGGGGHDGGMTAAGLGLVGAGAALTWIVRRRKGVES